MKDNMSPVSGWFSPDGKQLGVEIGSLSSCFRLRPWFQKWNISRWQAVKFN